MDKYIAKTQSILMPSNADKPNLKSRPVHLFLILKQIDIQELKGIKNCSILFSKPLTAVMGVNGIGKSTILHALASSFNPDNRRYSSPCVKMKFSEFFPPNPDASWKNSKFILHYDLVKENDEIVMRDEQCIYSKDTDRWKPRYQNQPIKDTVYIGISTCTPDIENIRQTNIKYDTRDLVDERSITILNDAAAILNKDYVRMKLHDMGNRQLNGVETQSAIKYSSLSMGAGEQRVFRILEMIHNAAKYSLILIDEIDLLLHPIALKTMLRKINKIAIKKQLQVVFTTHSLVIENLKDIVDIKYLEHTDEKTIVYEGITTHARYDMTGNFSRPVQIYVEDFLSQMIVTHIAKSLCMQQKVNVTCFGSESNGYSLAASMVIRKENIDNVLIVLDGERTEEERINGIHGALTGTEKDIKDRQERAFRIISQYNLPKGNNPEKYIHSMILENANQDDEIVKAAREIHAVDDSHDWLKKIAYRMSEEPKNIYSDMIERASRAARWKEYIAPIEQWLRKRQMI